jgi:MFS family permease
VSLTAIQADLMMTVTASQWVLSLAIMAVAASVSIAGWLSDRRGAVRILRWGLLIYLAATLIVMAAGFLRVSALLMAGRLAQGIGAALTFPTAIALVVTVYPAEQRGKAMGTLFAMTMLVTAVGPAAAGAIGDAAGWPLAYLMPLAVSAASLFLLARITLAPTVHPGGPFDAVGAALLIPGIVVTIFGLMQAGAWGLTDPRTLAVVGAGLALLVILFFVERRKEHPLIPVRVFESYNVVASALVTMLVYLPMTLAGVFVVRYTQEVLGWSATLAGLTAIATTLTAFALSALAGKLFDQRGARVTLTLMAIASLASSLVIGLGYGGQSVALILAGLVLAGAGVAFSRTATTEGMNFAPPQLRGQVSALFNTAGQFGSSFSVALLTAVTASAQVNQLSKALASLGATPEQVDQAQALMAEAAAGDVARLTALPADQLEALLSVSRQAQAAALQNAGFLVAAAMAGLLVLVLLIRKRA